MLNAPEDALEKSSTLSRARRRASSRWPSPAWSPCTRSFRRGRLAPPAAARGGAGDVDPARARRTDAGVNDVADIVADVRERGDAALADWSERFDGAAPRVRRAAGEIPEDAVLALADAVRRWHELQRPADLREEIVPGVVLERRWAPSTRWGSTSRAGSCPPSSCARCRRRSPGSSASRSSRPRRCRDRGASRAARRGRGVGRRWAAGDRRPRVRHGDDLAGGQGRRPGERVRQRGEAAHPATSPSTSPPGPR